MATMLITIESARFPLGQIVVTANAKARLDSAGIEQGLGRHAAGDWGDVPPEDAERNALGLKQGERLFSAYGQGDGRFWIITERDRSVTTVLLPLDY